MSKRSFGGRPLVLFLNELSLFALLRAKLRGRRVLLAGVNPWFPPLLGLLERLSWALVARNWIEDIVPMFEDLRLCRERPAFVFLPNIFARIEPWLNRHFRFEGVEEADPQYGFGYKQTACNYIRPKFLPVYALNAALERLGEADIEVAGIDCDLLGLYHAFYAGRISPRAKPVCLPQRFLNAVSAVMVGAASLIWLLRHLRSDRVQEDIFLAADFYNDSRDFPLYEEMLVGGPVLLVPRTPEMFAKLPETRAYRRAGLESGEFRRREFPAMAALVIRDLAGLWRRYGKVSPPLFFRLATMVHKRVVLRGFFNRWHCRVFFGRDDYNVDHVIRRQEINRIGGVSVGVVHAIPGVTIVEPMWRYVSFDLYYVFGMAVFHRYYEPTWARDMTVKAVTSFGLTRELLAQGPDPHSRDIAVFANLAVDYPELVGVVRGLAGAFPDRVVYVQMHPKLLASASAQVFLDAALTGLPNAQLVRERAYAVLAKVRYAFSDASTVIGEAIQFGVTTFCLDIVPGHEANQFRDYPGLCVTNALDAIGRLRAIEDGSWAYPRQSYNDLVELSGRPFLDSLREDLRLPRYTPPPALEPLS